MVAARAFGGAGLCNAVGTAIDVVDARSTRAPAGLCGAALVAVRFACRALDGRSLGKKAGTAMDLGAAAARERLFLQFFSGLAAAIGAPAGLWRAALATIM